MSIIKIRKVQAEDRQKLIAVEATSTPNLRYVERVFDQFLAHQRGEFCLAEVDGKVDDEVVACAKLTVMPDDSAWLETLRVGQDHQGRGIGKRLYERFFEVAQQENISTMRMYTGVNNKVSKGLAEHFGFQPAATFYGAWLPCDENSKANSLPAFRQVVDPSLATDLILPHSRLWNGFIVMNRTFYTLTPALCAHLTERGQVYEEPSSGSIVVLGARFMPEQAMHVGLFAGDVEVCLDFAIQKTLAVGAQRTSCLFPTANAGIKEALTDRGFQLERSAFVVMESKTL